MTTFTLPVSLFDEDSDDRLVCVYCDNAVDSEIRVCLSCNEYKGVMTIAEWEAYTNETWED